MPTSNTYHTCIPRLSSASPLHFTSPAIPPVPVPVSVARCRLGSRPCPTTAPRSASGMQEGESAQHHNQDQDINTITVSITVTVIVVMQKVQDVPEHLVGLTRLMGQYMVYAGSFAATDTRQEGCHQYNPT